MRSVKLLVAMAVVAAFVAGPVLAQDMSGSSTAPAGTSTPKASTSKHKKGTGKHHHAKKSTSGTTSAPATTPAQ